MREEIKEQIDREQSSYDRVDGFPKEWDILSLDKISIPLSEKARDQELETLSISAGIGFVNQAQKFGKELSGKQYVNYIVLRRGDFSYNKGNSKTYPQGCIYRLDERDIAAVPNVFNSFRLKKTTCNSDYYAHLFINGYVNHQLYRLINAGVRNDGLLNLYADDFYGCVLPVPPLLEQDKIAEILNQCDKVIELKQQFIEEERNRKKWLMQNLLDSNGNRRSVKALGWKRVAISDLCSTIEDGDWIESKDQSDCGIRLIQTGNIGVNRYIDKNEQARYVSQDTFERLNCTEVLEGDVLLSRLPDPIGRACMLKELDERAITAVDCTILRFHERVTANYFLQYASTDMYFKEVAVLAGGSTRTRISRKEIENLKISVPKSIDDQENIVKILSVFDNTIELREEELTQWQQKKKALMQLLLTGIVRVSV